MRMRLRTDVLISGAPCQCRQLCETGSTLGDSNQVNQNLILSQQARYSAEGSAAIADHDDLRLSKDLQQRRAKEAGYVRKFPFQETLVRSREPCKLHLAIVNANVVT